MALINQPSGRSGLNKVEVTPILYLTLLDKLESGRRVPYTKNQLDLAFSKYLSETKGPWKNDKIRDVDSLEKLATAYLKRQNDTFEKERRKGVNKPPTERQKREKALMQKLGLIPVDDKTLPRELRGGQSQFQKDQRMLDNVDKAADVAHAISMVGEPASSVAIGLMVMAAQSKFKGAICSMLLDEYESKAKNPAEKDIILSALRMHMGSKERLENKEKLDNLLSKENDAEHGRKLNELKPQAHDKEITDKHLAFQENAQSSTEKPRYEAPISTAPKKKTALDPYHAFSLEGGPKYIASAEEEDYMRQQGLL